MQWADSLADRSARRWLRGIAGRLDSGWQALAGDPSVWRAFDRHLAAVDDAVRCEQDMVPRQEPVSRLVLLAGHAHDVWTEAAELDWQPPADPGGWTDREWTGLRLLACLRLAADEPRGPKLPAAAEFARSRPAGTGEQVNNRREYFR
ncbi:DUF6401 family natural product biosynthesis protein [Amycolatopsis thermoflava]|uniref:Uncharacterized protein n=1 Tax=Amycolatopsis thermoflava TaxID=84480 RepID=A0A3N2H0P8_9PSEU|nr:DUF6401 family natural product biosynthesis protein [Amycolatopsis thermoflava]ROS42494.1 hypothetical protein EDD35_4884 [Amycolatopsis thermoflava]